MELSAVKRIPICLIFVPHQDDEINLIGNCIDLLNHSFNVQIVYSSTDSDKKMGRIRKAEAVKACRILGVMQEKITFLDYPDTPNISGNHFFENPEKHSQLVSDITEMIKNILPEIIIGTDFDYHSDHRMLSIALEESLHKCISKEYQPILLKGFCYETAYYGLKDYSAKALGKTVVNSDVLGNPSFEWNKRICLLSKEKNGYIWNRKSFIALLQHKSQYAVLHADSIINADNVFWVRRTDNLALNAKIISSSGNASVLNDFKIIDTNDILPIETKELDFSKGVWHPDQSDKAPWIKVILSENSYIHNIVLHGNPCKQKQSVKIELHICSQIFCCHQLQEYGRDSEIKIDMNDVQEIIIVIGKYGEDFGLSEIEIFQKENFDKFNLMEEDRELLSMCVDYKESNKCMKSFNVQEFINYVGFGIIVLLTKVYRKLKNLFS